MHCSHCGGESKTRLCETCKERYAEGKEFARTETTKLCTKSKYRHIWVPVFQILWSLQPRFRSLDPFGSKIHGASGKASFPWFTYKDHDIKIRFVDGRLRISRPENFNGECLTKDGKDLRSVVVPYLPKNTFAARAEKGIVEQLTHVRRWSQQ